MNKRIENVTMYRYLLLYFLIYAFIGWVLETFYSYIILGHFTNRGFLFGPLCPIYGFGGVILIRCLQKYKSKPLKLFIYSIIIFSLFEYVAGFILDAMFSARWWDYSNDFLNLNGRISIFYSLAWGFIAIVFINIIHPFIVKIIKLILKKIPNFTQIIIIQIAFIIVIVDFIFSSIKYLA